MSRRRNNARNITPRDLIARAKASLAHAKPAPWVAENASTDCAWGVTSMPNRGDWIYVVTPDFISEGDARFCAEARSLVPALAHALEKALGRIEVLEGIEVVAGAKQNTGSRLSDN